MFSVSVDLRGKTPHIFPTHFKEGLSLFAYYIFPPDISSWIYSPVIANPYFPFVCFDKTSAGEWVTLLARPVPPSIML